MDDLDFTTVREKALTTLSYVTLGLFAFVLLILRQADTYFLRYHLYQSILVGLVYFLLGMTLNVLSEILLFLANFVEGAKGLVILLHTGLGNLFLAGVLLVAAYCLWGSWQGKLSELRLISDQVRRML